jgi:hypothetical protein
MNERFLASILPPTFTILGKRLQKFSLTHAVWLQRLECDPVEDVAQLLTAVLVCSRPAGDIQGTLDDRRLPLKMRVWATQVRAFNIIHKVQEFHGYVRAHAQGPEVFEEEEGGAIPGAPFLQHVRATLLSRGWSEEYVGAESLGLVLWDYYTYGENEGKVSIRCKEVEDLKAWGDGQHEEILREANEIERKFQEEVATRKRGVR